MNREHFPVNMTSLLSFGTAGMLVQSVISLYETYLTVADVEQVAGLKGVKQIPFHPDRFLGSDLNFVTKEGDKILSIEFSKASHYNTYKVFVPKNFKTSLQGIGEEAFVGPDIEEQIPYLLVFRQGDYAVSLTAATTCDTKRNMLTMDQLACIGKIIAGRLP